MASLIELSKCLFSVYLLVNVAGKCPYEISLRRQFISRKTVLESYKTFELFSKQQCLSACLHDACRGICSVACYNKATKVCQLSWDDKSVFDAEDDAVGVMYIRSCIEEGFLINGVHPLPNEYMTASSVWNDRQGADAARLHNQYVEGVTEGSWCPGNNNDYQAMTAYIQVRFRSVSHIVSVSTQGRAATPTGCCRQWVEGYTLATSGDCNTFNLLKDESGLNIVFESAKDRTTVFNNTMPVGTTALCIRLHPVLVPVEGPCLRMDVWGCQQTQYP